MVPISLRMKTIADMVPMGISVADIGCDHGFVAIYMVQNREAPKAIAMDVNEGPLIRAKEHINQYGVESLIETRLSDGAVKLEVGEVDAAIIAGMGGRLTIKILSESLEKFKAMKAFVLSPHSDIPLVREYLYKAGFEIDDEEFVYDEGKYYAVMRSHFTGLQQKISDLETEYGPILIKKKHPILKEYLVAEIQKMNEIEGRLSKELESASKEKTASIQKRIDEISSKVNEMEQILEGM